MQDPSHDISWRARTPKFYLKKKIGHYSIRFLLVFFAVFFGFVADNIRENISQENDLREQMRVMVMNLKYDTTRLGRNLRQNLQITNGLNSFRYYLKLAINGNIKGNKLCYYQWRFGKIYGITNFNRLAIAQLKSTGLIRLIQNDSLNETIGDYYERRLSSIERRRDHLIEELERLCVSYRSYFSYLGFDTIIQRDTIYTSFFTPGSHQRDLEKILDHQPEHKLLTTDPLKLEMLYSEISEFEYYIHQMDGFIRYAKEEAVNLITQINEEYDFDE